MHRPLPVSRVYAVLDAQAVMVHGLDLLDAADALRRSGVTWVQYRDKIHDDSTVLRNAQALRGIFTDPDATLVLNDRAHLVLESGCHGVHLGQGDLGPAETRRLLGEGAMIGLSTHTPEQVLLAQRDPNVDYVAIGPIFATASKSNPDPCVDLSGLRAARELTAKPLVAIGGISADNAGDVLAAGADAVAVIGALFGPGRHMDEALKCLIHAAHP